MAKLAEFSFVIHDYRAKEDEEDTLSSLNCNELPRKQAKVNFSLQNFPAFAIFCVSICLLVLLIGTRSDLLGQVGG